MSSLRDRVTSTEGGSGQVPYTLTWLYLNVLPEEVDFVVLETVQWPVRVLHTLLEVPRRPVSLSPSEIPFGYPDQTTLETGLKLCCGWNTHRHLSRTVEEPPLFPSLLVPGRRPVESLVDHPWLVHSSNRTWTVVWSGRWVVTVTSGPFLLNRRNLRNWWESTADNLTCYI